MTITKVPFLYMCSALVVAVPMSLFELVNYGAVGIGGTWLAVIFTLIFCWIVSAAGNITRHIAWAKKGYPEVPIFLFPVLIRFEGKISADVVFDPSLNEIPVPPHVEITTQSDYDCLAHNIIEVEKRVLTLEIGTFVVIACVSALLGIYYLYFACLTSISLFSINSNINDDIWRGQITMLNDIRAGKLFLYLIRFRFLFDEISREMVWKFRETIDIYKSDEKEDFFVLLSWKFILASACLNKDLLDDKDMDYLERNYIKAFQVTKPFVSRELILLLVLYIYYGIIHDDVRMINRASSELKILATCKNSFSKKAEETFNFYIDIGAERTIRVRDRYGRKNIIMKKDYLYKSFAHYREVMAQIEMKVREKVQIQES